MTENYSYSVKPVDETAYLLWREYRPLIIKYLKNWHCNDIGDGYNQSYIYIFEALSRYNKDRAGIKNWVLRYLKQKLWNYLKTKCSPVSRSYYALKNPQVSKVKSVASIEELEIQISDIDKGIASNIESRIDFDILFDKLNRFISRLDSRHQYVLKSYYGIDLPRKGLETLANELDISYERVRQIRVRAEKKILSMIRGQKINIGELLDYEV